MRKKNLARISLTVAAIAFLATVLIIKQPRSLEDWSQTTASRYINGDVDQILANRVRAEESEVPETPALREALVDIHRRVTGKLEVVRINPRKGSTELGQAHSEIICKSKLHGKEFQVIAPCHLTPEGVKSPLSYYLNFLWQAEYQAENKVVRSDIPIVLESQWQGLNRDGQRLKEAGLLRVSNDGIRFNDFDNWYSRVRRFRDIFMQEGSQKKGSG